MATTKELSSDSSIREDVLLELKWDPKTWSAPGTTKVENHIIVNP